MVWLKPAVREVMKVTLKFIGNYVHGLSFKFKLFFSLRYLKFKFIL